eukprot:633270-Prorocentrum_minimum.AAC.1
MPATRASRARGGSICPRHEPVVREEGAYARDTSQPRERREHMPATRASRTRGGSICPRRKPVAICAAPSPRRRAWLSASPACLAGARGCSAASRKRRG